MSKGLVERLREMDDAARRHALERLSERLSKPTEVKKSGAETPQVTLPATHTKDLREPAAKNPVQLDPASALERMKLLEQSSTKQSRERLSAAFERCDSVGRNIAKHVAAGAVNIANGVKSDTPVNLSAEDQKLDRMGKEIRGLVDAGPQWSKFDGIKDKQAWSAAVGKEQQKALDNLDRYLSALPASDRKIAADYGMYYAGKDSETRAVPRHLGCANPPMFGSGGAYLNVIDTPMQDTGGKVAVLKKHGGDPLIAVQSVLASKQDTIEWPKRLLQSLESIEISKLDKNIAQKISSDLTGKIYFFDPKFSALRDRAGMDHKVSLNNLAHPYENGLSNESAKGIFRSVGIDPDVPQPPLLIGAVKGLTEMVAEVYKTGDRRGIEHVPLLVGLAFNNDVTGKGSLKDIATGAGARYQPRSDYDKKRSIEVLRGLQDAGIDIDVKDGKGRTALMRILDKEMNAYGGERKKFETYQDFLEVGSDPTIKDNSKRSALEYHRMATVDFNRSMRDAIESTVATHGSRVRQGLEEYSKGSIALPALK